MDSQELSEEMDATMEKAYVLPMLAKTQRLCTALVRSCPQAVLVILTADAWSGLRACRGYDMRSWTDANYLATIEKYNLQDLEKAKHLCPKLYFEPRGSSEEEDFAEMLADDRASNATSVSLPKMRARCCS